ncbi:MAG: hypothetical protein PHE43_00930 [Candidatus Nanoarchaeia archaeon]|nr:hypothetical protein [Candidatus Nanoarchaeia archaeon]
MSSDLGEKLPYQVLILVVLGIMVAAVVAVLHLAVNQEIKVGNFESDLMMKRLFYSSDCFALEDLRVYPGTIDMNKFTEERLKNCISTDNLIYAKIGDKEISNDIKSYKDQLNLCKLEKNCYSEKKYVLVENKLKLLEMGVILDE